MFPADSTPKPLPHIAWQAVDGEVVIIDLQGRVVRGLNRVGSAVWGLMDGKKSAETIARTVAQEYAVDLHSSVIADVFSFLGDLREKGLIG